MNRFNRLLSLATALLLVACQPTAKPSAPTAVVTVVAQKVVPTLIQDTLELDGSVAPKQQVNLVARIPGTLERIHFQDGEYVERGQLLFTLERAPYLEQVKLNQARLEQARTEYQRQTQLLKENATSQSSVDTTLSNQQQAEANLRLAQINLDYTEIRAPFSGMLSRRLVDVGNYVGATPGGTVLATLMQISPAYVNASLGEREALRIRKKMGGRVARSVDKTLVSVSLQNETAPSEVGVLDFIDHQIANNSGTIALRAQFANPRRHLIPGFYAKLQINLGPERSALVVPRELVQINQQGEFIYVVDANNVVHQRLVTSELLPDERKEILSGLQPGELVVFDGYNKLRAGQTVAVQARRE